MDTLPTYLGLRVVADRNQPYQWIIRNQVSIVLDHDTPCPKDTFVYRDGNLIEAMLWGKDLGKLKATAKTLFGRDTLQIVENPLRHDPRIVLFSNYSA